jgi:hypothetical protein
MALGLALALLNVCCIRSLKVLLVRYYASVLASVFRFSAGLRSAKYLRMKVFTKVRMTGPRMKARIPRTANPGVSTDASQKQSPFTTSENKPKLTKLSGRDSVDRTGFAVELTNPITKAAINAAGKFAKSTPGTARSTTSKLKAVARAVKRALSIKFSSNEIQLQGEAKYKFA